MLFGKKSLIAREYNYKLTMDIIEQIILAHKGDKAMRDEIVQENIGLVWSIVRRFLNRGYEADDLFQIGCIGLLKAIDKFDIEYDVKFSTYAVPMISGEIKRFLRDDGLVKVSRTLKENGWKIKQASEKLSHELGRDATLQEIAAATELSKEEIVMAMEANVEVESIYKSIYQNDGNEIYMVDQVIAGGDSSNVGVTASGSYGEDVEKEKLLNRIMLKQLMDELDERERKLIEYRYFNEKTQSEVAKIFGISQVQVSRMEKKILMEMRKNVYKKVDNL